ncbi:hypothetical protein B0O99DRAFT_511443 [Bisporella sp. PMI_857]|nr:hypothetical protein B0O99DRAFT_511443 [Bisporella sp. PMI_857]
MLVAILLTILVTVSGAKESSPSAIEAPVSYENYHVYRIISGTLDQTATQRAVPLRIVEPGCNSHAHGGSSIVAVHPEDVVAFESINREAVLINSDLSVQFANEADYKPYPAYDQDTNLPNKTEWFTSYHLYNDHVRFLQDIQAAFPNNSELISAGSSFEGRELLTLHLWGKGGKDSKPAVLWQGTAHCREWIGTMVTEYLAYELVEGYLQRDREATRLLDRYDYYISPVVNPDGFIYTQTTDRLWRNNRQIWPNSTCIGANMNRNYPFSWGIETEAASDDPCDPFYNFRGFAPASTTEVASLIAFAEAVRQNNSNGIKWFVDFHSQAQAILYPYGDCTTPPPENIDVQVNLTRGMAEAIFSSDQHPYKTNNACIWGGIPFSGISSDYMSHSQGAEYAWGIELRDSSGTESGGPFALLPQYIIPSGKEMWKGVKYVLKNA